MRQLSQNSQEYNITQDKEQRLFKSRNMQRKEDLTPFCQSWNPKEMMVGGSLQSQKIFSILLFNSVPFHVGGGID